MKKIVYTLLVPSILLTSCGGEAIEKPAQPTQENITNEEEEIDYSDMTLIDMSEWELPAKMMLPLISGSDEAAKPEVEHNEDVTWKVRIGDKFDIVIEDWGTEEMTIARLKEENLQNSELFTYEIVNEDEDEILFKKGLTSEQTENAEDHKVYGSTYFYFIRKVGDTYYTIESNRLGDFSTSRAKAMLRSAKSLQPVQG